VSVVVRAESIWGTSTGATKELWTRLRDSGTYALQELSAVLEVLGAMPNVPDDAVADSNCSARRPSLAWGLLSLAEQEAWYAGERRSWTFDAQNLATAGPAGLRLGMLAPPRLQGLGPSEFTTAVTPGAAEILVRAG
jgi:hypothetical protein